MVLGPRLDLRTSQTLVISPQLQTAIRLLALSNLELAAELAAELERNPLLELESDPGGDNIGAEGGDGDGTGPDRGRSTDQPGAADRQGGPDGANPDAANTADPAGGADLADGHGEPVDVDRELVAEDGTLPANDLDVDYTEERFHHDSAADSHAPGSDRDLTLDSFAARAPSLSEILEQQLLGLGEPEQSIARAIIGQIDEAGYLTESVDAIAAQLGLAPATVERVLLIVQGFEPTGVGARTLAECIALQAREADRYDPCMAALIANLDLVARGEFAKLQRICGVDAEDLRDMLHELRNYDPKPGLVYGSSRATPVIADVFVRRRGDRLTIELNAATLPRLIVNRQYEAEIAAHAGNGDAADSRPERKFLKQCQAQAHWLMKMLDQRADTILKVATAIVGRQRAFFDHGVAHLVPLTLREIADEVEMHESTISRVTSNKYLSSARGIFELKYFFTTAIASSDGSDSASAEAVRQKLKSLVDLEDPLKPLSDSQLARLLAEAGFDIARRTIAKYREALGIPASFDRRRRALLERA